MKKMKKYKAGAELKNVPAGNKGLPKLPKAVRNQMGYKKMGGEKLLMQMGGSTDMSEEFVMKMRRGGDMKRYSYKYGGSKAPKKMMQSYKMGGWTHSGKKKK